MGMGMVGVWVGIRLSIFSFFIEAPIFVLKDNNHLSYSVLNTNNKFVKRMHRVEAKGRGRR